AVLLHDLQDLIPVDRAVRDGLAPDDRGQHQRMHREIVARWAGRGHCNNRPPRRCCSPMSRWQFFLRYGLPWCSSFIAGGLAMLGLQKLGAPESVAKVGWAIVVAGVLVLWYVGRKRR